MVKLETNDDLYTGEGETVLAALKDARVLGVVPASGGRFEFIEWCDEYFSAILTREQVLALADELRALAMPERGV